MSYIIKVDLDSDSSMTNPINKELLKNSNGSYYFRINDLKKFAIQFMNNEFDIAKNVCEILSYAVDDIDFYNGVPGYYQNGNYCIELINEDFLNIL